MRKLGRLKIFITKISNFKALTHASTYKCSKWFTLVKRSELLNLQFLIIADNREGQLGICVDDVRYERFAASLCDKWVSYHKKSMLRIYLCRRSYTQGMVDPRWYYCSLHSKTNTKFCPFDDCQGVAMAIRNHYLQTSGWDECAHQGRSIDAWNICSATSWKVMPSDMVLKLPIYC